MFERFGCICWTYKLINPRRVLFIEYILSSHQCVCVCVHNVCICVRYPSCTPLYSRDAPVNYSCRFSNRFNAPTNDNNSRVNKWEKSAMCRTHSHCTLNKTLTFERKSILSASCIEQPPLYILYAFDSIRFGCLFSLSFLFMPESNRRCTAIIIFPPCVQFLLCAVPFGIMNAFGSA